MIELVKLAKKGDKNAFDEIIRLCVPEMFRVAMSILHNKDDADDAVCESVLVAYESIHMLKKCKFFRTWIVRILINRANAIYKNRNKVIYLCDIPDEAQYEDIYDLGSDEINAAVANLGLEFRTVIILYYYQEMRIKEIAEVLQVPQGTVKWRLSKAKSKLKENLTEALPPEINGRVDKCKAI